MSSTTKYYYEQIIRYNKAALEELRLQGFEQSLSYLKQALVMIKKITEEMYRNRLIVITFNNLGSFFKKTNNFPEALKYLNKIVELEEKIPEEDSGNIANAHLSICTILSKQNNHIQALRHGLRAIYIIKKLYRIKPGLIPSLIIAYQNVGAEYKFLGDVTNAENTYKIGYKASNDLLGPNHSLTYTLKENLDSIIPHKGYEKYNQTQRHGFRNLVTPISRLPDVNRFRSNSDSRQQIKKPSLPQNRQKSIDSGYINLNSTFYDKKETLKGNFKFKRNYIHKLYSDEEETTSKTDKSKTSIGWSKKIDLQRHKETEKIAATLIQSWWKGIVTRSKYKKLKMIKNLKNAEIKAKKAVDEYENLKKQAEKLSLHPIKRLNK